LFHGSLLSAAAPSSRSTTVIDQVGSNRRSSADNVALMIPVPTSTASTFEVALACWPATEPIVLCVRASCIDRQISPAAFDPLVCAVSSAVLLGPPLNGGAVIAAVPYRGRG
jgi:hypothetical protein